jgi:hypothetical protein
MGTYLLKKYDRQFYCSRPNPYSSIPVKGQFHLGKKIIPGLSRAVPVNCGEGRDKLLIERCNHAFGGIDSVIVGWDKVDVHMVASDVHFDGFGTFVVHNVERG